MAGSSIAEQFNSLKLILLSSMSEFGISQMALAYFSLRKISNWKLAKSSSLTELHGTSTFTLEAISISSMLISCRGNTCFEDIMKFL